MKIAAGRPPNIEWAIVSACIALAALFAISVFVVGFDLLASNLSRFDLALPGLCLVLAAWQLAWRFLRWFMFARCLGLKISFPEAALYYAAGMSMALTPGRIGEALRLWFLEKRFAARYRRTAGLYVADRAGDVMAYLVLLGIGSAAYSHALPVAWSVILIVVLLILILMKPRALIGLITAIQVRWGKGRRLLLWARRALRNTSTLFQPRVFVPGIAIGTVGWLAAPVTLVASLSQLGIAMDLSHAAAVYSLAALAGGSTMMPGGGGATEAVLVVLLTASNVPLDAAVSAMIVVRLAFLFVPVGIGILVLPVAMKAARSPAAGVTGG